MKYFAGKAKILILLMAVVVIAMANSGCTPEPPPYIVGQVSDARTGDYLNGVEVTFHGTEQTITFTTQPGLYNYPPQTYQGSYEFVGLTPGPAIITAFMAGYEDYVSEEGEIVIPTGGVGDEGVEHNFALKPLATVRGRVIDAETGLAIESALVSIQAEEEQTGPDGRFEFNRNIPEGDYTISVTADEFAPYSSDLEIEMGDVLELDDIELLASDGRVRGTVTDIFTGTRLGNVTVTIAGAVTTSQGNGNYDIRDLPYGTLEVTAQLNGYIIYRSTVEVQGKQWETHDIQMTHRAFYVTNILDNNFSLFRTSDSSLINNVSAGNSPTAIAFTPSHRYLLIASQGDNNLYVFNQSGTAVVATVPVGQSPTGLIVTPDSQRAYVTNQGDQTVSVVDLSDFTVTATVPAGVKPLYGAVTPDGEYVYVTNQNSENITVIRTSDNTAIETISVTRHPIYATASPDGQYIYVTHLSDSRVSVIDTSTNTVANTFVTGTMPTGIAISPAGDKLYVASLISNSISVHNPTNGSLMGTIATGSGTWHVAFNSDGTRIYATNQFDNTVTVIDPSDDTVLATVTTGENPWEVAAP